MIDAMGPLPPLHRLLIVGFVVLIGLGAGIWMAGHFDLPLGGIGVGLGAGSVLAFVLVHDFRGPPAERVTRRR